MKKLIKVFAIGWLLSGIVLAQDPMAPSKVARASTGNVSACGHGQRGDPASPNIIRCEPFEKLAPHGSGRTYGPEIWAIGYTRPPDFSKITLDHSVYASGAGSMKMNIPSVSTTDPSGNYHVNFQDDLGWQVGDLTQGNVPHEVFVQWRERDDAGALAYIPDGRKMIYLGAGDYDSSSTPAGYHASACDERSGLQLVMTHQGPRGTPPNIWPLAYYGCPSSHTGSVGFGFEALKGAFNGYNTYQNRVAQTCNYLVSKQTKHDYSGCFAHVADEWATYEIHVKVGHWNQPDSCVEIWMAHEGQNPKIYIDGGCVTPLTNDDVANGAKLGKVWMNTYTTNRVKNVGLESVDAAANGSTVYHGRMTRGKAPQYYVGNTAHITGFSNPQNNGDFPITSEDANSLTVSNPNGVAETGATGNADIMMPEGNVWYDDLIISKAFIPFPGQTAPLPPTALQPTATTPTSVTLGWTENNTENTGYEIYGCKDVQKYCDFGDSRFLLIKKISPHANEFTVTGLSPSTEYTFRIADAGNNSVTSNEAQVKTAAKTAAAN